MLKNLAIRTVLFSLLIAGTLFVMDRFIVLPSIQAHKSQELSEKQILIENAFSQRLKDLNVTTRDWAIWDSAYNFVLDPIKNHAFIEDSLQDQSFSTAEVNLIYLCDLRGKVIWGKSFDLVRNDDFVIPGFVTTINAEHHILSQLLPEQVATEVSGLIDTPRGIMMISSIAIEPTERGTPVGRMILGRFITETMIKEISTQISLTLRMVYPLRENSASRSKTAIPLNQQDLDGDILDLPLKSLNGGLIAYLRSKIGYENIDDVRESIKKVYLITLILAVIGFIVLGRRTS